MTLLERLQRAVTARCGEYFGAEECRRLLALIAAAEDWRCPLCEGRGVRKGLGPKEASVVPCEACRLMRAALADLDQKENPNA